MMNVALQMIIYCVILVVLAIPLGSYMGKVMNGERVFLSRLLLPVENLIYRGLRIDKEEEMDWKKYSVCTAVFSVMSLAVLWAILCFQNLLPLNPQGMGKMSWHLGFNTAASFTTNTNWQAYSGESSLSYFSQMIGLNFQNFVSAAVGIVVLFALIRGFVRVKERGLGNFYTDMTRTVLYILIPLSVVVSLAIASQGVPQTFKQYDEVQLVEPVVVEQEDGTAAEVTKGVVPLGPAASQIAIKQLGTNGGGYFGTNSAHPLENPNAFTNILECWSILILPMAMVFAFGFYTRRRRLAAWIFGVMLLAYTAGVVLSVWQETGGSRQIDGMGISQELGSMEGKEIRIGSAASAMWGMTTTVTSNGSVNSMHDSQTPLSGMLQMLNMQINCWFGGVGVGWMNYFAFLIIAVFISGLMVGRTPEFLGRKVEAREMKIATLVVLLHPFLILVGTGISAAVAAANPEIGWLNNPSFHGLSEMLYEYTSSAANNGSGFEGLADNTPFWNISTGIALIMGRYFPIVGQVAIAGLLASKKCIPESAGTLRTDTGTFSLMTFAVIIIVAALSFFPALALGPIADYLTF